MKLDKPMKQNPIAGQIIKADEKAASFGDESLLRVSCPRKEQQKEEFAGLSLMIWHIRELGGGLYMSRKRPNTVIQAIATLIFQLKVDICLLTGITKGKKSVVTNETLSDGSDCLRFKSVHDHSGVEQVNKIVDALKKMDSDSGWKVGFMRSEKDNEIVYRDNNTSCFVYRSRNSLSLKGLNVVESVGEAHLGLFDWALMGEFEVKAIGEEAGLPVCILGPMGIFSDIEMLDPETAALAEMPDISVEKLPEQFIFGISSSRDLSANLSTFNSFRSDLDADYKPLFNQGTVMTEPFWEVVSELKSNMVGNSLALNASNIYLHERMMSWEAMEDPQLPDDLEEITGIVSDFFIVRNGNGELKLRLREMRPIDLMRAVLPAELLREESGTGSDDSVQASENPEDALLAEFCENFNEPNDVIMEADAQADRAGQLHLSMEFCRQISDHWPVVAKLKIDSAQ